MGALVSLLTAIECKLHVWFYWLIDCDSKVAFN